MRSLVLVVFGIAVGTVGVMSLRPTAALTSSASSRTVPSPVELALERNIPEVWLDNVPLTQAAAELSKLTGVPVKLDVDWMQRSELSPAKPVTVRVRNADLMSVLGSVTQSYNADREAGSVLPGLELSWYATGEGILIGVWDRMKDRALIFTRIYDIAPLVPDAKKPAPVVNGTACFPLPPDTRDDLVRLLQETVNPLSWREVGGEHGTIARLGNRLIVVQSLEAHVQLRRLLDDLISSPAPLAVATQPSQSAIEGWTFHPTLKRWVSIAPERADAALWRVLPSFELAAVPFSEALERLAFAAEFDVLVDDKSFAQPQGKLPDQKITLATRGVPAWRILRQILDQAASANAMSDPPSDTQLPPEFVWWVDGGVVIIGRTPYAGIRTRVYYTRDYFERLLVDQAADMTRDRSLVPKTRNELAEDLIKLLVEQIDPASWRENGGRLGAIRELSGQFLISQTWENHEHLRPLIEQLTHPAATRPVPSQPVAK